MWVLTLGLFKANVIQLGMDQLLEASSDQLSSFIHWYYWSSSLKQVTHNGSSKQSYYFL